MELKTDIDRFDLKEFYVQTHRKAYNFALKHCREHSIVEDILQTAYVNTWLKRNEIHHSHEAFQSYLHTTIYHLIIKEYRRQLKEREVTINFQELLHYSEQNQDSTTMLPKVFKELNTLPPKQQTTFRLAKLEGYTYQEVAEVLSISVSTVEKHVSKVLKTLRERLACLFF